jgi:hypothetical protein
MCLDVALSLWWVVGIVCGRCGLVGSHPRTKMVITICVSHSMKVSIKESNAITTTRRKPRKEAHRQTDQNTDVLSLSQCVCVCVCLVLFCFADLALSFAIFAITRSKNTTPHFTVWCVRVLTWLVGRLTLTRTLTLKIVGRCL